MSPNFPRSHSLQETRGGSGTVAFWRQVGGLLSRAWWAGVGVLVAILLAVVGYFLASGGSPTGTTEINNVHGTCDAAGNNNTVNCVSPGAGPSR